MIEIRRIELREIALSLVEPFRISSGVTHERRIFLVRVESASGAEGWGECVAGESPNYSSETIDTAWMVIERWLGAKLLGRSWRHPSEVPPLLDDGVRGHRMAKAALEMASWELAARELGEPLAALLGGSREAVETGISLGVQENPSELVTRAEAAAELGYRRVKLKIMPGKDREEVAAVRSALGPEATLSVDANAAYTPDDAAHLADLDEYELSMIEQPLAAGDLLRHADLARQLRTPLCLDESIVGPRSAEDMLRLSAGRIVNIKPGRVGGFTSSLAIHDICRRAGIPVWCGGMLESGIGRAHNVALASLPGFTMPGDLSPSARYWKRDVVDPEWTMDAGLVRVPGGPGMGVAVDRERIASITRRERTLTR